jgi:YD repeat-containing protein
MSKTSYDYPSGKQKKNSCKPDDWTYRGTMEIVCNQKLAQYENFESNTCKDSTTEPTWLKTMYSYDNYGNRNSITDPATNTTTIQYDKTYNTFPSQHTWPNGLTETYIYEPGFGKQISKENVNKGVFTTKYDSLGRRKYDYGPNESKSNSLQKFKLASYTWESEISDAGTRFYRKVSRVTDWQDSSQAIWSKTYYDGLGRS